VVRVLNFNLEVKRAMFMFQNIDACQNQFTLLIFFKRAMLYKANIGITN